MFHLRNFFNISIKVYRQPTIHKVIKRQQLFSASAVTVSRIFLGAENKFAHSVLENNPKCRVLRGEQNEKNVVVSTEIDFDQNWEGLTTDGIVECLETIGNYCEQNGTTISDERFDKFVGVCTKRCADFTDDQLIQSLQILARHPLTESPKSRNFAEVWNAFDDACVKRIDMWDANKILYVCDHWYMLHLGRFNKFIFGASLKIGSKLRRLPPHQLLQLMFYLSIKRTKILDMLEIETNFVNSIDDFNLNEIAVMCMAFFKTQTALKTPKLIENIYKRSIREIDTVEGMALTCILKTLRHSAKHSHVALVKEMLDAVKSQLSRLSTLTCFHVALLGTHLHLCHQSCIEEILHRFSDDVKSMRLKDLERISYVMGFFDFKSESNIEERLCEQFLAELKNRDNEIVQRPKCFALCLHYLTMKGYYDKEMISLALSPPFLNQAYGDQCNYDHELFGLDSYVKINLKETYRGNELTVDNRQYLGEKLTDRVPERKMESKISFADDILLEVKETSDKLCTHSYFAHALPHFNKPDIIIAFAKNSNTGINIAHNLPPLYTGKIIDRSMLVEGLNADAANVEIIHIIVCGWGGYVRDTLKMTGFTRQKFEQSKILGLRPVLVPYFDWKRLREHERKLYVKLKIKEALLGK